MFAKLEEVFRGIFCERSRFRPGNVMFLLFLVVIDQATKNWALVGLDANKIELIPSFFEFSLYFNRGISFACFKSSPRFLILGISLSFFYILICRMIEKESTGIELGEFMMFAGALGNFIDRLLYGYVIDCQGTVKMSW